MADTYDLIVLGGGSGGVRAARLAAAGGARTALVESKALGGTCVNVGCVPKKLFAFSSHYSDDFHDAAGFGWSAAKPSFDFGTLRDAKDREIARLNAAYEKLLGDAGVEIVRGYGTLDSGRRVQVDGPDARTLEGERVLVATGSAPSRPPIEGIEHAIVSDDIFHLPSLPKKALVIGGGYIAIEFASILNGWGVETALLHRGPRILTRFDGQVAQFVQDEVARKGVVMLLEDQLARIAKGADGTLTAELKSGGTYECDLILSALGRTPSIEAVADAGVETDKRGAIQVDKRFRTSAKGVFALGDVIGRVALTPVAIAEAKNFVGNEFQGKDEDMDYADIATAVFCNPNIGTVGLTEEEAQKKGIEHETLVSEFRHMRHALTGSDERTLMKAIVAKDDGRVIGMHMVGADAGEIIQGFAVAMKCGLTRERLNATIGIHPTAAEEFVTL